MTRVRTILVSCIEYWAILAVSSSIDTHAMLYLYSHAILVSSDGWYNYCDVPHRTAAAFD